MLQQRHPESEKARHKLEEVYLRSLQARYPEEEKWQRVIALEKARHEKEAQRRVAVTEKACVELEEMFLRSLQARHSKEEKWQSVVALEKARREGEQRQPTVVSEKAREAVTKRKAEDESPEQRRVVGPQDDLADRPQSLNPAEGIAKVLSWLFVVVVAIFTTTVSVQLLESDGPTPEIIPIGLLSISSVLAAVVLPIRWFADRK